MKNFSQKDEELMERCLVLAEQGRGYVNPNPMVGCVIVKNGRIIGEGHHKAFGGPHAEVYALKAAGKNSKNATLYVNLEPCSHFGKTPPCADAIVKAGIKKVIVASQDPNPLVAGKGLRRLREAGIDVRVGLLRDNAERLNKKFYTFMKTRLPFVGIKIAQTLDGRIADSFGRSKWITSEDARKEAHRIRSEYDAILVGATTVQRDNPELTVRNVSGRNPIRVVLDGRMSVSLKSKIFDTRHAKTILLASGQALRKKKKLAAKIAQQGAQVVAVGNSAEINPETALRILASLGISSVLIEGGSKTISAFLKHKAVNQIHCFVAPKILGDGLSSMSFGVSAITKSTQIIQPSIKVVGSDFLIEGSIKFL
ncbi:MAG: bifunctional diaminohydroxyphosphoribosylaminopyrimidine deaminase/5-amino-6-(5-phosphoribosylamino)uracil reductase RibD [Ignavibacteriales bacterium]|nr:bifunctional diaminohydroxyphosphoribosylaminopyrimidine deaminase/5-amino-6-(5-phosphoribosylamino)uracil reductase RibD [Ignavibacteriales bacterium]